MPALGGTVLLTLITWGMIVLSIRLERVLSKEPSVEKD